MMPIFTEIINIDKLEEVVITNLKYFFDNPQEVRATCNIQDKTFQNYSNSWAFPGDRKERLFTKI